jgi:hypothetical protein
LLACGIRERHPQKAPQPPRAWDAVSDSPRCPGNDVPGDSSDIAHGGRWTPRHLSLASRRRIASGQLS